LKKIIKLDDELIDKIAAGEVVERPASIVKELIENSIDAGADEIHVQVKEGGKKEIIIDDNGTGIPKNDIELAFERHSTSKLKSLDDLTNILTLGFRGEALSSISAVSRLEIESKTPEAELGIKVKMEGGKIIEKKEIARNQGTRIKISDIFFNTPARRKFMKSKETEFSHILDLIENYALIYPEIYFSLEHNSKEVIVSPKSTSSMDELMYLENISYILGKDIAKEMIQVKTDSEEGIKLTAFIGKPAIYRKNSDRISIFVNKRYIKSQIIVKAVKNAYKNLLLLNYYPIALISLEIDPTKIDVNVHPQKREIRFSNEELLFQFISESIRKKLEDINIVRVVETKRIKSGSSSSKASENVSGQKFSKSLESWIGATPDQISKQIEARQDEPLIGEEKIPKMRYLGQIFNIYLLFEGKKELYIVDQHAAAERIQYEKLLRFSKKAKIKTQTLLSPLTFDLPAKETEFLLNSNNVERLEKFGFDLGHFGGNSWKISKIPIVLGKIQDEKAIIEFFEELNIGKSLIDIESTDKVIKLMACHSSLRGGEVITAARAEKILVDLRKCKNSFSCCHGRPTIIKIDENFLEKKFQRRV